MFRAKYPQLKLPDNPFRSTRVIIDFISERGITPEANAVIQAEKSWYYRDFVNRWFCEDKDVAIVYDKNTLLDFLLSHMPNPENTPDAERRKFFDSHLSQLKHWKQQA